MAAYCQVYDSRHLQADCQEPGSAPEPYARQSSTGYHYLFFLVSDISENFVEETLPGNAHFIDLIIR